MARIVQAILRKSQLSDRGRPLRRAVITGRDSRASQAVTRSLATPRSFAGTAARRKLGGREWNQSLASATRRPELPRQIH